MSDLPDSNSRTLGAMAVPAAVADPFAADAAPFREPTRVQGLNLLYYLMLYSRLPLVLTGPQGSGKSTLLQHLTEDVRDHCEVYLVDAASNMEVSDLLVAAGCDQETSAKPTPDDLAASLGEKVARLHGEGRFAALVVDNAHRLNAPALGALLDLPEIGSAGGGRLRVLLCGEPELEQRLRPAGPALGQHRSTHLVELSPFSEADTAEYIQQRLSAAGVGANHPFTPRLISRIHEAAGGWPGRINELAQQALREAPPAATPAHRRRWPVIAWATSGAVGAALLGTALYQWADLGSDDSAGIAQKVAPLPGPARNGSVSGSAPKIPASAPRTVSPQQPPAPRESVAPAPPVSASDSSATRPPPAATILPAPPVAAPAAQPSRQAPIPQSKTPVAPSATGKSAASQREAPHHAVPPAQSEATSSEPTPSAPSPASAGTASPSPAGSPVVARESWLLAQSADRYTLQLLGTASEDAMIKAIANLKLKGKLAYFRTRRNGRDWFGLVWGVYDDQRAALNAAKSLPASLGRPWLRTLAQVQADVRLAR